MESVIAQAFSWWITLQVVGAVGLPVTLRLFAGLPARGWTFAKPLALLLFGYCWWILGIVGVPTARATLVMGLVVAAFVAIGVDGRKLSQARPWFEENRATILTGEGIFLVFLLAVAIIRSYVPEIVGTEKPMELAFLNATVRSDQFPPYDPWLAGYSISYYYFGYVLMGLLTKLTATPIGVAFNLAIAVTAGLAALSAYGVGIALLALRPMATAWRLGAAALSSVLLLAIGNLVGVLDFLHAKGFGSAEFWDRIAIDGLNAPYTAPSWYPTENWWWWKATRVINTFDNGQGIDYTISEFPAFSFVLADLHPHVLALPFNLLVVGIAIAAFTSDEPWGYSWMRRSPVLALIVCVIVGSLGFLNPWDLPAFGGLVAAAVLVRWLREPNVDQRTLLREAAGFLAVFGVLALGLFLPFYLGFSSQASGIRPVVGVSTQPIHFFLFWGPLITISGAVVVSLAWFFRRSPWLSTAITTAAIPLVAWLLITAPAAMRAGSFDSWMAALPAKAMIGVPLTLVIAAGILVALQATHRADAFAGLAVAMAGYLIIGADLFFIVDVFTNRMNTVFKFYYQGWTLLAAVGGYAFWNLVSRRSLLANVWTAACVVLLAGGLYYTTAAVYSRANLFKTEPTLDGLAFARQANPDEATAIQWLAAQSGTPVVVEATGGQYSEFARVSTRSGLPTILGWAGHERQWRGSDDAFKGREAKIDLIYSGPSLEESVALLKEFGARYVFVGTLERQKYGQVPDRLASVLDVAYKNPTVTIYQTR